MVERSKEWVCCRSLAGIAGSNSAGGKMSVSCECCVLSGTGLCEGPINRPTVVCLSVIVKPVLYKEEAVAQ